MKKRLIFVLLMAFALTNELFILEPSINLNVVYAAKKTKKKKSVGSKAKGKAKVWDGDEWVQTDDAGIVPAENEKVNSGVYGENADKYAAIDDAYSYKNGDASEIITNYLYEVAVKHEPPRKNVLQGLLKEANYTSEEIKELIAGVDWVGQALEFVVYKINSNDLMHINTKTHIESELRRAGFNEDEILTLISNCGITDWEQYTVDYVKMIVNSAAGAKDDKLIEKLEKCGLGRSEAVNSLKIVLGRELR